MHDPDQRQTDRYHKPYHLTYPALEVGSTLDLEQDDGYTASYQKYVMDVPITLKKIYVTAEKVNDEDYWGFDDTLKWPDVVTYVYSNGVEETVEHVPNTITSTQAHADTWDMSLEITGSMEDVVYMLLTFGIYDGENGTKWQIKFNRV